MVGQALELPRRSAPSHAGDIRYLGSQIKCAESQGEAQPTGKASRTGQSVNRRALAAGLQAGMLWSPAPGEHLQMADSTSLGSVGQGWHHRYFSYSLKCNFRTV